MKNFKFKIIASLLSAALIIPAAAVHAEGTSDSSKLGSALVKQQERLQKAADLKEFKASMTSKKDTIKKDHETNQALRKAIAEKRTSVKGIVKDIKDSHKILNAEDLSKIEEQMKTIESDKTALEGTKGTIRTAFDQFKTEVKNRNYEAASAELDKIISIQTTRTTGLTKLSTDLDTLISLLQTAASKA